MLSEGNHNEEESEKNALSPGAGLPESRKDAAACRSVLAGAWRQPSSLGGK
jgi:hypothetical protein